MARTFLIIIAILNFASIELKAQCGARYQDEILFESQVRKDIRYGQAVSSQNKVQNLYLDFYEPAGDTLKLRPLLIFLHGGSFLDGSKSFQETVLPCQGLAKRGYTVAAVGYRTEDNYLALVFSELMFKATIRAAHDARAAIRFFYKQAKEQGNPYRIDTNQIFLGGLSAGAITALQTAYLDDISEADFLVTRFINDLGGLEGNSGNEGYSTKVKGVINIAGCMLDKTFVNNNKNIPLLNIQYKNDIILSSYYGRPYNILTMPVMMGSNVISKQMDLIGIYNMNYRVDGRGHVPYWRDGRIVQQNFDSTMYYMSKFMFSLLTCNPGRVNIETIQPKVVNELSMYPNPASGYIILGDQKFDINLIKRIRVIDLMGRVVLERRVEQFSYYIDLSEIPNRNSLFIVEALGSNKEVLAQQKLFISK